MKNIWRTYVSTLLDTIPKDIKDKPDYSVFPGVSHTGPFIHIYVPNLYRAWDLGEEKYREVQKFPLNRGDNKPRRCERHF